MLIIIPLIQEYYYIFRKNFTRKSRSYDFEKLRQQIFPNHCENYRESKFGAITNETGILLFLVITTCLPGFTRDCHV